VLAAVCRSDGSVVAAQVGQPFAFWVRRQCSSRLWPDQVAERREEARRRGAWVAPFFPTLGMPGEPPVILTQLLDVQPGDCLVLCSDGMNVLSAEGIATSLLDSSVTESPAERLGRLAIAAGCRDNVSAAVVHILQDERET
jgi:serine/threonine protein phosphatase PrpC